MKRDMETWDALSCILWVLAKLIAGRDLIIITDQAEVLRFKMSCIVKVYWKYSKRYVLSFSKAYKVVDEPALVNISLPSAPTQRTTSVRFPVLLDYKR